MMDVKSALVATEIAPPLEVEDERSWKKEVVTVTQLPMIR
jgi:hypothetical protein